MSCSIMNTVINMNSRICDKREDSDLTQQQVADYLSCDQSLYSKYERGLRELPLVAAIRLALLYETSIDYLVGLTNEPTPHPRAKGKK